ncbi:hypothetical protein FQ154_06050 [Paeniglutamicibacter gangotriensis]|uniref:Uncharacterized protein n=1 Tax=Paeniglutamicibacter gangotriensis TaxID=254787 RepID=A0A5B0EIY9_9MICC|nr:hypothetical protein FQ154_06050 [Paeniglutamicibacter gangotriensis]
MTGSDFGAGVAATGLAGVGFGTATGFAAVACAAGFAAAAGADGAVAEFLSAVFGAGTAAGPADFDAGTDALAGFDAAGACGFGWAGFVAVGFGAVEAVGAVGAVGADFLGSTFEVGFATVAAAAASFVTGAAGLDGVLLSASLVWRASAAGTDFVGPVAATGGLGSGFAAAGADVELVGAGFVAGVETSGLRLPGPAEVPVDPASGTASNSSAACDELSACSAASLAFSWASSSASRARRREALVGNSWLKSAFGMSFVLS